MQITHEELNRVIDVLVEEGTFKPDRYCDTTMFTIRFGQILLKWIYNPKHSRDSMTLYINKRAVDDGRWDRGTCLRIVREHGSIYNKIRIKLLACRHNYLLFR